MEKYREGEVVDHTVGHAVGGENTVNLNVGTPIGDVVSIARIPDAPEKSEELNGADRKAADTNEGDENFGLFQRVGDRSGTPKPETGPPSNNDSDIIGDPNLGIEQHTPYTPPNPNDPGNPDSPLHNPGNINERW